MAELRKWVVSWVFLCMVLGLSQAQNRYQTAFTQEVIVMDGYMNEEAWKSVESATDFTIQSPVFGGSSRFPSKFKLLYDDDAIYIAGELHDPYPDSVRYSLSSRDDEGNADWVKVTIDTYGGRLNAFSFGVTAAGVEIDALESVNASDRTWNAVWKSHVEKRDFGWSFEMQIPYAAIRFPNKSVQNWNVNFHRTVRRNREESTWSPIDPHIFGGITQSGKLIGVENIQSPLRLSFTPYATGYLENSYDSNLGKQTWKNRVTGGMDVKYGFNDAFTLDMTLIPDFGQTLSDRQILNLGPFEVRYDENRPFFIEGTDLFQTGGIFYSRRIGSQPFAAARAYEELNEGEQLLSNPSIAPLINGTKVSGRTKSGLGIGVFNALEGVTYATIKDSLGNEREVETNPLSSYNVFVLSQNLKNNSVVSLVNTNVMRSGGSRDANVTAVTSSLYTPNGKINVAQNVRISAIFEGEEPVFGHSVSTSLARVAGVWRYSFSYSEESDSYNPNDLGFIYNNNWRNYKAALSWNDFHPTRYFFRRTFSLSWTSEQLYKPQLFSKSFLSWSASGMMKKQIYTVLSGEVHPLGEANHFESRKFGHIVTYQPSASGYWYFTTDYSKRFALDGSINYKGYFDVNQGTTTLFLSPRIRFSDRMLLVWNTTMDFFENDYGFVSNKTDNEAYDAHILMGFRDRTVVENSIRTEFIFTNRMGVDLRLRHYWQQVEYANFRGLEKNGEFYEVDYNPLDPDGQSIHNTSYNAFTVDVNYRWVFLPGSELRIVYKNNLFHSKTVLDANYFQTFESLFDQPQVNSISLKVLFYIDALMFKRKEA